MSGELPFIDTPHDESEESHEQGRENVGAGPRMAVTTGLERNQEQSETNDREGSTNEVDALENGHGSHAFCSHMRNWEVCE